MGGSTCTLPKSLGLALILARPTATRIPDRAATADVPCRMFDPRRPIEIDLTLTDIQVFLVCAGPFFCPAKRSSAHTFDAGTGVSPLSPE